MSQVPIFFLNLIGLNFFSSNLHGAKQTKIHNQYPDKKFMLTYSHIHPKLKLMFLIEGHLYQISIGH